MYKLKTPISTRKNGETVMITELPVPDMITVEMVRGVKAETTLDVAHGMAESIAKLNVFEAAKLESPDALGYLAHISDLLEFPELGEYDSTDIEDAQLHDFDTSKIKPIRALIQKITVDLNQQVEFCAQVLELNGYKKDIINGTDIRIFKRVLPEIIPIFTTGTR